MLITHEKADIIGELLKHTCRTCAHARTDDNLPDNKRICLEGYGFKHMMTKSCSEWTSEVGDTDPQNAKYTIDVIRP